MSRPPFAISPQSSSIPRARASACKEDNAGIGLSGGGEEEEEEEEEEGRAAGREALAISALKDHREPRRGAISPAVVL
jgi:hypothetical protein